MDKVTIKETTDIPVINIVLDTLEKSKQALVFCNTRKTAESTAEKIAEEISGRNPELDALSEKALSVLSTPTKQCRRLAFCIKKGIAFHHAGLAAEQRHIVEENFKKGVLKVICSTPTLAMGINLPAFRAIIKDLKRYGGRWGMEYIPALEYHQMAGRAGRPDFNDEYGEAICIATSEKEAEDIVEKFINAPPEKIFSKLAVEPALRTYCLSLVATGYAKSKTDLISFFEKTFYGHQYGDMIALERIISKILKMLEEWEFIDIVGTDAEKSAFVSASDLGKDRITATKLGERVAELYLDPYTAFEIITSLRRATQKPVNEFSFLQMTVSTLELRPLPTVRVAETPNIENELAQRTSELIVAEPSVFEPEYEEFLKSIMLALCLNDWMDEKNEEDILETYNIAPGELHFKRDLADWMLYATEELANLLNFRELLKTIRKTRFRLDKGIKEELVPLARIRGIGRIRARLLFRNGIKDVGDIKKADLTKLSQLLGKKVAENLKEQSGEKIDEPIPEGRRKGQTGISKFD
jgi:helicase